MMAGVKITLTGDWEKSKKLLIVLPLSITRAIDKAVLQEAQYFRTKVVMGFNEQAPGGKKFKPLEETTLALRRFNNISSTKALLVRGDLRNSIKVTKRSTLLGAEAFIGVHKTAKGRSGSPLINIAYVHEFGSKTIVIEVTPAMRKYLMMVFSKTIGVSEGTGGGGISMGIIITKIPPRPFLQPVIDKDFNTLKARLRFQSRVLINLKGVMGIMAVVPGVKSTSDSKSFYFTAAEAIKNSTKGPGRDPTA
jgi:hypothetical protein